MEIQMGSGAKSCMKKGFPIYEEIRKFFTTYEEAGNLKSENSEAADMNGRFQMQGGKNWILPK
jgi:hypothetical protein